MMMQLHYKMSKVNKMPSCQLSQLVQIGLNELIEIQLSQLFQIRLLELIQISIHSINLIWAN